MPRTAITRERRRHRPSNKPEYTALQWQRGLEAECRFFEAVRSADMRFPDWMFHVREATSEQNLAGFDVVIDADCGRMFFNIKCTENAVESFHARENRRLIPCILIADEDKGRAIVTKLLDAAERERARILKNQREA